MRSYLLLTLFAAVLVAPSGSRAAEEWGLIGEEVTRFEATVVDVLCELTGDCPASCGGGDRQLGLVTDEGRLVLAFKNFVAFAGASAELIDFCGKRVTADGLFATNRGVTVFALQFVREAARRQVAPGQQVPGEMGHAERRRGGQQRGQELVP